MSKPNPKGTSGKKETDQSSLEQSKHLLQTKFYIPSVRSNQIARPRLINLLSDGLDKTLILVSAPAGYGKSTLVSAWLKETSISSAWLSLDAGDNDPSRFLQYLLPEVLYTMQKLIKHNVQAFQERLLWNLSSGDKHS